MNEKLVKLGIAIEKSKYCPHGHREGQNVFNVVFECLPEEANQLRGSSVDPFYNDGRIPMFWTTVVELITG